MWFAVLFILTTNGQIDVRADLARPYRTPEECVIATARSIKAFEDTGFVKAIKGTCQRHRMEDI